LSGIFDEEADTCWIVLS